MIETEAKIRVSEEEFARVYLALNGPAFRREENWGYSIPDGFIRVREEAGEDARHYITLKKNRKTKDSSYNSRHEAEVGVSQGGLARDLLSQLGFKQTDYYRKERAMTRFEGCVVCLDKLRDLGFFVEVEGDDEVCIGKCLEKLGLSDKPNETRNYFELTRGDTD